MKAGMLGKWAAGAALALAMTAGSLCAAAQDGTVLKADDARKILPPSVYYKAQSAPTQLRNSGGVKFADGYYVLAMMVDTSGYSSDVATKYQAYFIAEVPIKIGGHELAAGIYGIGFIADNKFVVTDVGAHELFTVNYITDEAMKRPVPLQVTKDEAGSYRLYTGRKYVTFSR